MHLIITDAWLAKSRAIYLTGTQLIVAACMIAFGVWRLAFGLMVVAAGLYHLIFLKGARECWPMVRALVKLLVKDEFEQRDRFIRENLDVMAKRVGEM